MRRRITSFILSGIVFAGMYGYVVSNRSLPVHSTVVDIAPGSSFAAAAAQLQAAGVAQALPLRILARLTGKESALRAGALIFPAHENLLDVLENLSGKARTASVWLTVPEGYTAVQIEQNLRTAHLRGASGFAKYAHRATIHFGNQRTLSLEGFLFPDTYLVRRDATASEIASAMVAEFRRQLPAGALAQARHLGYTLPQVVTIASLIEREAQVEAERPLMAGVYYHRLAIGMPLEVDASLEYAFPHHETEITGPELRRDTPYNTYLHAGLPPTPIANPGLHALKAALYPTPTQFLYYVYKGGGRHAFAETYQEHQANVNRYLR